MKRIFTSSLSILAFLASFSASAETYFLGSLGSSDDEILKDTAPGFKLALGTSFHENLDVEMGLVYLGSFNVGSFDGTQSGIAFSMIPTIRVGDSASLYAKAGLLVWHFSVNDSLGSDDGSDAFLGVGVGVDISDTTVLVLEYEDYEVSGGDVSMVSAGVRLSF